MAIIKNRKFCPQCKKQKFLFESETKAKNFLKFNHDTIKNQNEDGKAPIKAYYCTDCCGWHVTSKGYEQVEFNVEPVMDEKMKEEQRKKELKHQLEIEKSKEILEFYIKMEEELQNVESLIQGLNFQAARMHLLYLKNSKMQKYSDIYIHNNKRFAINNRIERDFVILQQYIEKFTECIDADSLITSLEDRIEVAETLYDMEAYADAKSKAIYVNDILKLLKDKCFMQDERDDLQRRIDNLYSNLSHHKFKDNTKEERIQKLEQIIKRQEMIPTLLIIEAAEEHALEIVQFQMQMAYETEGIFLDVDMVAEGVYNILYNKEIGQYIIAKRANVIVGCLKITKDWDEWTNSYSIWVRNVYVRPDFRKQGVYSFMYSKVKELAIQNECNFIRVCLDNNNKGAIQVHASLGMKECNYILYEDIL